MSKHDIIWMGRSFFDCMKIVGWNDSLQEFGLPKLRFSAQTDYIPYGVLI